MDILWNLVMQLQIRPQYGFHFILFFSSVTIAAQKCVLKFLPSRVALGHASSLLSLSLLL
jgi:hypothetical protein